MSRYQSKSHYYYPGTETLINFFQEKDPGKLDQIEIYYTSLRQMELIQKPIKGNWDFDHLKSVHEYIFQDIYPFAGQVRTENISKGFQFAPAMFIESSADNVFMELQDEQKNFSSLSFKEFADRAAYYMAEINVLHPFREGNGRALREFIRELAVNQGYSLDWNKADKDAILLASIRSTVNHSPLAKLLEDCMVKDDLSKKKNRDFER